MAVRNVHTSAAKKQADRLRKQESAAPVGFTSITRGGLRIASDEGLLVEGSARVTGTLLIDGILNGDGTITWTGTVNLDGPTNVTDDLTVSGGGKIKVGTSMVLDPTVAAGALVFSNGAQVFTDGSTVQVYLGNGVVQISNTEARLQLGGTAVRVTDGGIQLTGLPVRTRALTNNAVVGTVWSDTAGNLYRVVA